ncbi:MAG: rhodanese-like domain-containing protein [Patescibacteria group bacterium]|nr:rhodanese-like domain-containing protein [Patescibacteria group bacterium]
MAKVITHVSDDGYEMLCKQKIFWNLDVREKYEFEQERIKGAKLVPATHFDEEFEKLKVKKTDKIDLYCQTVS